MNFNRAKTLFNIGLIALMIGLFTTTFVLNRNHYITSIATAESAMALILENQANAQLFSIAMQEREIFELHKTPKELEANLFIVSTDRIIPACTVDLIKTTPPTQADQAFEKGIAALPAPTAQSYFERAARRMIDSPHGLYRKISAYLNLLELDHNVQTICCILTLLDNPQNSLTPSQKDFFHAILAEQVPNLESIAECLAALQKTANELNRGVPRKKGDYRIQFNGQTLSVTEAGLALLYSPKTTIIPPVKLVHTRPDGLHREILTGLFAFIPQQEVNEIKVQVTKQYRMGNGIIVLMFVLGTGLAIGLFSAAKRQHELDAMKTEFIATVSHELRTPLSLIRLHAETLHHGRVPEDKIHNYHQTILTESERLSGIVNNVLDFSRMERGKMQLNLEPTNLSETTERIVESFRYRLEKESFELERKIKPGVVASADALAYSQILFNLIDNAIKYSDGEKHIRIELESADGWNILRVSDHGIGIPDKLKKKIFDDFVRSNDRKVTARRGSGIGLSVARRLTEKMNGTIEVEDNEPTGSVFTVKLRNSNETTGG